jgi:GMP synthase-like glutamine amidotransferase
MSSASLVPPPRGLFIEHQADAHPGHLGDRAVQRGVEVVVHFPADATSPHATFPDPAEFDFVVALGSGDAAYDEKLSYGEAERAFLAEAVERDVPVLGVCFGAQMLARALGGQARRMQRPEIGWVTVDTTDPALVEPGPWLTWHFDTFTIPPGAVEIARTPAASQAFVHGRHLAVQFHPEATVSSVASWARRYAEDVVDAGGSVDALNADTRRRAAAARSAAIRLFDRFWERSVAGQR